MMPQPATRSHRQLCDGLRFRATPRGRTVDCGLRLGIDHLAIPIEAHKRPPVVAPARKFPANEDMLSRQHGSRKASVRMKIQRKMKIFTAGARDAVDIEVARPVEGADALVGVEPNRRSAEAGQAVDLLIRTQFYIVEASILASAVVTEERAGNEPPRAEKPLAGQHRADEVTLAVEPSLTDPAWDAGNLDVPLEDDKPRPAISPSFRDLVAICRQRRQHALWCGGTKARRPISERLRRLACAADFVRGLRPQVHRGVA